MEGSHGKRISSSQPASWNCCGVWRIRSGVTLARGRRADRSGEPAWLARPDLLDILEQHVEALAARVQVDAGRFEVIRAVADAQAENQTTAAQAIDAGGLFGEQGCWRAVGPGAPRS
jgi:hypothetical protein